MAYILHPPESIWVDSWYGLDGASDPHWPIPWAWWSNIDLASSGIGSHIQYAVEIFTETDQTDNDIGLIDGVFRYITGRPGYSGSAPYPQWGPDEWNIGVNVYKWFEGFLTKDGMSNPSRTINIDKTGDYRTLSNFSCNIRNNDLIWTYFRNDDVSSNLNLLNKEIRVYVIIDGVFYQIWGGVITDTPRNETQFIINCSDYPSKFHKDLPRNRTNDKTIPVTLGENEYIKGTAITSGRLIDLITGYQSAPILQYALGAPIGSTETLNQWAVLTEGKSFSTNELSGKYLFVTNWSVDDVSPAPSTQIDEERGLLIVANDITTTLSDYTTTYIYTSNGVKSTPKIRDLVSFNQFHTYLGTIEDGASSYNCTYVKCMDVVNKFALADSNIVLLDDSPYSYDSEADLFVKLPTKIENNGDGTVSMKVSKIPITEEGFTYQKSLPITVNSVYVYTGPFNELYLDDSATLTSALQNLDQNDYITLDLTGFTSTQSVPIIFDITLPDNMNYDDLWIVPDITISPTNLISTAPTGVAFSIRPYDPVGNTMNINFGDASTPYERGFLRNIYDVWTQKKIYGSPEITGYPIFFIPEDLYPESNKINPRAYAHWSEYYGGYNYYSGATISDDWFDNIIKISDKCLEIIKTGMSKRLLFTIQFYWNTTRDDRKIYLHQLQLLTSSAQEFKDEIYVRASGENNIDGSVTDNVFGTFKYILEKSDGIDTSYIDYGNLSGSRLNWSVGRQITNQKNSKEYLKELAKHSYVALFPDRLGKRAFNCWLDNTGYDWDHDENSIVRDSISQFVYTPMRDIYSDFYLEYGWSNGSNKYTKTMYIANTDSGVFPLESSNWTDYVGGIDDYTIASGLWSIAHSGYLITSSKQSPANDITQLPWFITEPSGLGSVYKYLNNLVTWTTKQHINSDYAIPVTSGNININLTDTVKFNDKLYTNDRDYYGWVDKIEYNINKDQIKVGLFINPDSTRNIIIDAGTCIDPGSLDRTDYTIYDSQTNRDSLIITRSIEVN